MLSEPMIVLMSPTADQVLSDILRQRYTEGYRIVALAESDMLTMLSSYREQGDQVALVIYNESARGPLPGAAFLKDSRIFYPEARRLLITSTSVMDTSLLADTGESVDQYLATPWEPVEQKLYPVLDELLAEWRASMDRPFMRVRGIMTVRAVRIRLSDTLHRAAEVIALSGVGDLMVIDDDNNFVGVLSVGDVLRAAMPDTDEILSEGGTLEQAFRLFLRKGSELMYKPVKPLVITSPLVVDPDDHVAKVAALMIEKNIHRLPVVKEGRLIGTVGRTDICQAVVGTL